MKRVAMSSHMLTSCEKHKLLSLVPDGSNPFSGRELLMSHLQWYPDEVSKSIAEYRNMPIPEYCERVSLIIEFSLFPDPKLKYKKVSSVRSSNINYRRVYIISMLAYVYGTPLEKIGNLIGVSTARIYQILRKGNRILHNTLSNNMTLITSPMSECYNMYALEYPDRFIKLREYADILSALKLS